MSRDSKLIRQLLRGKNAFDFAEGDSAGVVTVPGTDSFKIAQGKYQPPHKAQVQANILTQYYTVAAGVYAASNVADILAAGLIEALPVFMFANGGFASGYAALQANFPLSQWTYGTPFIFGRDFPWTAGGQLTAVVTGNLRKGDLVQPYTATVAGTDYVALRIVRFSNVAYGDLLESTNSNLFKINMIRYTTANTAVGLAQFANPIYITNETMFGKFTKDSTDPESYQNPEQNQPQIVDVNIKAEINKEKGFATLVNYDVTAFRWNLFIADAVRM